MNLPLLADSLPDAAESITESAGMIDSPIGVLTALAGVSAVFFWLEKRAFQRFFQYAPPLIFIYLIPVIAAQTGLLTTESPVYGVIGDIVLPMMLVLLLVNVDVRGAVRVLGPGVAVMLIGTLGVMIGAPIGFLLVKSWLGPDAWKAFGTLAGSWIGGTGNMAAISKMIEADGAAVGLAVIGDSTIYLAWLPLLLASKNYADRFARFSGVAPDRLDQMKAAAELQASQRVAPKSADYLALLALAFAAAWIAEAVSAPLAAGVESHLPEQLKVVLSASTINVLLITTIGLALSFTPARQLPGSHELGMALVYLFVARMGAMTKLDNVGQTLPFLAGASVWIAIHGAFCLLGAKLLKVDIHTAAIASAANIGGPASASIVAMHHEESLVPAAVLMGLLGYAVGNFAGYGTALLCWWVS